MVGFPEALTDAASVPTTDVVLDVEPDEELVLPLELLPVDELPPPEVDDPADPPVAVAEDDVLNVIEEPEMFASPSV
jgi:hypothetical protein